MTRRAVFAALLCAAVAWPQPGSARKSPEPPTLADLARRPAPVQRDQPVVADVTQAARSYQEFLEIADADPAMRAQALRRLGDLRLDEAEALRAGGGPATEKADASAREAVAAYQRLLEEYPDAPTTDTVLYQLARAYDSLGDAQQALAVLDRLAAAYPSSAHIDEVQFRRGEAFFGAGRYDDAERAYAAVLSRGPSSPFYEQSLYKRGWALFKESRDAESTAAFLALLDSVLTSDGRVRLQSQLSRPEQELTGDTLHALAITFAAADGPASLQSALDRHGPAPYESRVYQALGDLYVDKERFQDGADAYRAFASRRPLDPDAPLLLVRATHAYAKGGFTALVLDSKRQLIEQYGPRSEFWRRYAPNVDPAVSAAVQSDLLDLARHHHALAQKGSVADRADAVRWYREYLDGFDDSPQAAATRLLLADLLFDDARYQEAAVEFERSAYSYPANPDSARAGYAALVAFEKAEAQVPAAHRAELHAQAVESALRFADAFPGNPEVPAVLTRTARMLFDDGDGERAATVAQRVLALGPRADASQQRIAWTVIAHTAFDAGRYADAEHAYAELADRLPADDAQRQEIIEHLAASVYRQAEAKQASGDVNGAVKEFLRVSSVAPTSTAAAKAEFDAGTLLVASRQWQDAARVLEQFRSDHPRSELQPEVTRKLAVAYLEDGRQHEAAVELEKVAAQDSGDAEVRRAALWQAAELYGASGDPGSARRAYTDYLRQFPLPFDAAIEARQQLAELAATAGDAAGRGHWLEDLVAADAAAGAGRTDHSRFLAAQASLELARALDQAARSVRLTRPLERTLVTKKTAIESALAAYKRAADYGIAQFTTASSFAMAELYRDLGRALLESERPTGLTAAELEQYNLLLEEQAYPFEEKAIAIHEQNARRAADGVYDEWVRKSYAALAEMKPARYARVELLDGPAVLPATPMDLAPAIAAARAALDAGRDDEACRELEAMLALDPSNVDVLNLLGVCARRLGRFADARAAYERAAVVDPTFAAPQRNIAILLDLYIDDAAASLPHYERYAELAGGADTQVSAWLVELRTRLSLMPRTAGVQQ